MRRFWPTRDLKPGESFLYPTRKTESARQTICHLRLKHPKRQFVTRFANEEQTLRRMWRIDGLSDRKIRVNIEFDIPVPPKEHDSIYPFREMDIGDSFLIKDIFAVKTAFEQASRFKRYGYGHFTIRKIAENEWRCWRLK